MRPRVPIALNAPTRMKILPQRFTVPALTAIAKDMARAKGKGYRDISGGEGLLARVTRDKTWTYMVKYKVKGEPSYRFITIGDPSNLSIESAYNAAKAIRALAAQGVDIRVTMRENMVQDLLKRK